MTREEAIAELSVIWERLSHPEDCENGCYSFRDGDYLEALDMAIEALQNLSKPNNELQGLDLISRQAAIDALMNDSDWADAIPTIESLPSSEPNIKCIAQIRIDRDDMENLVNGIIEKIAEPKTGKWVDIDNYYRMATCSRCHKVTMFEKWGEYTKPYHYCPNCGADMRDYFLEDPLHPRGGVNIKVKDDKDCVFCDYCTDIFWDYTNLIYMITCEKGHDPWNRPCKYFEERGESYEID